MRCAAGIGSRCHRLSDRNSTTSVVEAEEEVVEEAEAVVVDLKWKSLRSANEACGLGKRATKKRCPS
jgi:hypothetical protein